VSQNSKVAWMKEWCQNFDMESCKLETGEGTQKILLAHYLLCKNLRSRTFDGAQLVVFLQRLGH
jgi:hypothetical protein